MTPILILVQILAGQDFLDREPPAPQVAFEEPVSLLGAWDASESGEEGMLLLAPPDKEGDEKPKVEISFGARAVQWVMFDSQKTIESGGVRWKLEIEDALGAGVFVEAKFGQLWIQKYFDYLFAVLTTADTIVLRTLGGNIGWDLNGSDGNQRVSCFAGVLYTDAHLDFEEQNVDIPGDFDRSLGGQFGCRYMATLTEDTTPTAVFMAELALRYSELRFDGDAAVGDRDVGRLGLVMSVGAHFRF